MNNIAISLNRISKSYGKNRVLRSINFSLTEGTIMGLIGKNGAGKTTMIKILLGLIKPDEGETRVFTDDSWHLSIKSKHRIGYVPQEIVGFGWMSVENLLAYTGSFYNHWNTGKVKSLLDEWQLDPYAKVSSLSVGERQKLAIIQAMGHEPDLFIFDEPVASLDPVGRRKFIKELIDMNISENKTVLFSTHITSDLERVAADISLLKNGEISFTGDLATLKDRVLRLRVNSKRELPDPLPIPNIINSKINKNNAVVTVDGVADDDISRIENELSAAVTIEHLNLEDIFLELNR